jgi:hypothetical protein
MARVLVSWINRGSALALALAAATAARPAIAQEIAQEGGRATRDVAIASPPAQLVQPPSSAAPPPSRPRQKTRGLRPAEPEDTASDADSGPELKEHLRLNAGPLSIEPEVLMQVQAVPYVGAGSSLQGGDAGDRAGFRMRRARFGFDGRLFHRIPFEINVEYNSDVDVKPTALLHDAWFGYDRFRLLEVFVGTMDVPFSRSALTGSGEGALIERPYVVRALAPMHQLGARLEGHLWSGVLNYYAGIYNGLTRSSSFFTGYLENPSLTGKRFDGLTYSGRITSEPLGGLGRTIEDLHHGKFRIAAGASGFYSDGGTSGVLGLGGDLLLHAHGLHVLGELIGNRSTPKVDPSQATTTAVVPRAIVTSLGAVAEAGYVLMRDRLGITCRFEWLDPDTTAHSQASSWILTGGASYHILNDFLKAQLDYNHREEIHGSSLKNDSLVFQVQLNL